ncbi:TonB-dependent receptor [Parvularcula sp. LCG005]|uniref:TonB-dependent receptor n=1 Tax=Parvularcula sp. LCG005 TaxID=3078805 RepID=UPI002942E0CD|nr:TonB-dependent receptor [Parvularcula sp. LCG005]WOI53753.1 TonB-dependent receptor [Parvularcula sp. LCG005]
MTFKSTLAAGAATFALVGSLAFAQETTGAIRGVVTDEAGAPISGATVTVDNTLTGASRTVRSNSDGRFQIRNLAVTGDYTVTVGAAGFAGEQVENLSLSLGDVTSLTFDLEGGSEDQIVVVGKASAVGSDLATGPSAAFGIDVLENAPAINRDIKDIVRLDPRVYLDESFADAVQCAGANPRFNSLTVDGIRLNDNFGLNSNGYPTERIPFSYDAISQVAVELAPFDVEYGSFTSCNINAVTKSGGNEFHGGAFFDYTSDYFKGDELPFGDVDNGDYTEQRYGFNVGGPIIKDRLFFFAAYEMQEGSDLFGNNTPTGKGITDAEYQQIVDIASDVYGYTVGGLPTSLDNEDEKLLVKLDWNIMDGQRASFTYNYNDGYSNSPSDNDPNELPEFNHFYKRGATLNSYAGSLYSTWTDALSTEVRISYIDLDNIQDSFGGLVDQIGEVQINVGDSIVYLGPDDSRHSNELNYELWTYKAKADYAYDNHLFTFGVEREEFDVFNLFVQESQGEFRFDSIADFASGDLNRVIYENAAGTNNVDDGAAKFAYEITTAYAQDDWQVTDALNVVLGVRADFYTSDDKPIYNAAFQEAYGIRNDDNLDGKSVIQPRFGFTYDVNSDFSIRGGAGLFAGGNPNVWISNNYSNNGVTLYEFQERGTNIITDYTYNGGRPLFDIPQEGIDAVANANGRGAVNALDPNFEIPSEWKYALGFTYDFDGAYDWMGNGYTLMADILYSKVKDSAYVTPISYTKTGTAPDGRPLYAGNDDDFVLSNAGDTGYSLSLSAALSKSYDFGLDWTFGYAYTESEDTNPMTSSVAFSNYQNFTRSDALNPTTATSDYEIPHRFTLQVNYEKDFFAEYTTRFSLFGQSSEGSPYSYTFGNTFGEPTFFDNNLFYVPTGAADPLVSYDSAETQEAVLALVNSEECLSDQRGQIADRNSCHDDWWTKFDLRVSQDLPGLFEGHRSQAYIVLENVGNFIDSDYGVLRQQGFPGALDVVNASIVDGQFVYSNARSASEGSVEVGPSLWEMRFGIKYDF